MDISSSQHNRMACSPLATPSQNNHGRMWYRIAYTLGLVASSMSCSHPDLSCTLADHCAWRLEGYVGMLDLLS